MLKDVQKGIDTIEKSSEVYIGFSQSFSQIFTLKSFSTRNRGGGILRLEKVNREEDIVPLLEKAVFTDRNNINQKKKDVPTLTEDIIGTKVIESIGGNKIDLGVIVDIIYAPAHDIWIIERDDNNQDLNFPATDNFIISHNTKKKEVLVTLPEGLKEL